MVVEDKKPEVLDLGSDGEKESGDESQSEEDDDVRIYNQILEYFMKHPSSWKSVNLPEKHTGRFPPEI